jgi:hypothetical protein
MFAPLRFARGNEDAVLALSPEIGVGFGNASGSVKGTAPEIPAAKLLETSNRIYPINFIRMSNRLGL